MVLSITVDISTKRRNQSYQYLEEWRIYLFEMGSNSVSFRSSLKLVLLLESSIDSAILVLPLTTRDDSCSTNSWMQEKKWLKRVPDSLQKNNNVTSIYLKCHFWVMMPIGKYAKQAQWLVTRTPGPLTQ